MRSFPYDCPFCGRGTTINDSDREVGTTPLTITNAHPKNLLSLSIFVVCPNPECQRFTFSVLLFEAAGSYPSEFPPMASWQLVPASEARTYPDYVPKPIRDDYEEACLIRDLSPKASATLARRCLQGMIRDFHGVRKGRLKDEIDAIEDKVAPLTWQAIDKVRGVGNIGAHMEKDINVIVDVEPQEAAMLIGLIEMLIEDWYVNRYEREQRLNDIVKLGETKEAARKPAPTADGNQA